MTKITSGTPVNRMDGVDKPEDKKSVASSPNTENDSFLAEQTESKQMLGEPTEFERLLGQPTKLERFQSELLSTSILIEGFQRSADHVS